MLLMLLFIKGWLRGYFVLLHLGCSHFIWAKNERSGRIGVAVQIGC
jgi:hypothetical protein